MQWKSRRWLRVGFVTNFGHMPILPRAPSVHLTGYKFYQNKAHKIIFEFLKLLFFSLLVRSDAKFVLTSKCVVFRLSVLSQNTRPAMVCFHPIRSSYIFLSSHVFNHLEKISIIRILKFLVIFNFECTVEHFYVITNELLWCLDNLKKSKFDIWLLSITLCLLWWSAWVICIYLPPSATSEWDRLEFLLSG